MTFFLCYYHTSTWLRLVCEDLDGGLACKKKPIAMEPEPHNCCRRKQRDATR